MREWLSGGASPCQGEGRGFDPRLALIFIARKWVLWTHFLAITRSQWLLETLASARVRVSAAASVVAMKVFAFDYQKILDLGLCKDGQKILDLGTGTGVLPRNLYSHGAKWIGTDISEEQIQQAKKLCQICIEC